MVDMQSTLKYTKQLSRFAVLLLALLLAGSAFADTSKISPDLLPLLSNPSNSVNVIVQYNSPPQTCTGGGLLGPILCLPINLLGGVVHFVFSLINAVSGTLLAGDRITLSNQSNVNFTS